MPALSHRITTLNGDGSDGWDVFYRARAMIADGVPVTELTIGEHDIGTDPSILKAMYESALGGHTGYAIVPGISALRDEVAARVEAQSGVPTRRENVLITPGGQAGLFAAHMAVCAPGDVALFVDPYYATYPGVLRSVGAVPRAVETRSSQGFLPQRDVLKAAVEAATSLLINTPNNPTGAVYPRATLHDIAEVVTAQDMWLISDEVYDTQVWDGAHISPRALPGMAERTLVIGSMSKSHAMTGSRIGWIVGPEDAITCLVDLATNTTYGVPGYIQDAALFGLRTGLPLEAQVAEPFRRRRAIAERILASQTVLRMIPAQGAMYVMLDVRATGMNGEEFAFALLDAHHIAVMPGESFGRSAAGHVRVAMTQEDSRFKAALRTLCEFASALAKAG
ncbi:MULTISPECIES: pyridoxal phosphate-dependent aminotransferase [Marivita]|uniref:Aminotransferase n=1 Tax=Marivita cryptomonadis TaxID=505252 RepID=A0A9Q2P9V8_9RHOB|nr:MULTISPECIES: pyridoxal phosphate-dependent aminotransferase [Marivita]MCR9169158.1 pyridoxal phosphate-dependent aminotransferase [Paracoccaceae bacterium]MBM2320967.1 pyridoxal phosphate-dependent aminotransferase [Marivita cryptomonadis]MBM2330548.1 pyridoxal phosphate-dependent aminotransferase [Marivita cryptomonadis]MBM2340134.1 pyridoxal phosphate-dependent aminotransferase [Marivita cryptomonadis]MBM2344796.1 pyridoxal phosphate-dependent aminotransferase [Marivita cryptomonadis]